jgi:hypothetical protein
MPRFGSGKDVPSPSSMAAVLPKADIDCYRHEVRFPIADIFRRIEPWLPRRGLPVINPLSERA